MNSRVKTVAVAAVAAFAVLAGWGEDYQMVMADLPEGSPQRLIFTVNFETGELVAGLRSGEGSITKDGALRLPCKWSVNENDGREPATYIAVRHDLKKFVQRKMDAMKKRGVKVAAPEFKSIGGEEGVIVFGEREERTILVSIDGKVLVLSGDEARAGEIAKAVRAGKAEELVRQRIKSKYQGLSITTKSLGAFIGPHVSYFLGWQFPVRPDYATVAKRMGKAELTSCLSDDYAKETCTLTIEMDTEENAASLVEDWQKSRKRIDENFAKLSASEVKTYEEAYPTIPPMRRMLSWLSLSRKGRSVELRFDYPIGKENLPGAFFAAFNELLSGYGTEWRDRAKADRARAKRKSAADDKLSGTNRLAAVLKRAERGNSGAMVELGSWYQGQGKNLPVAKDFAKAVSWYRKAAEADNHWGMSKLGSCYEEGIGVEKSGEEAVKWYRKAAERGGGHGMIHLGLCYEKGVGVEKDLKVALHWFLKAAKACNNKYGDVANMKRIAAYYEKGYGMETPDPDMAKKWVELAELRGRAERALFEQQCVAKARGKKDVAALGEPTAKKVDELYSSYSRKRDRETLDVLLKEYPNANRTGCAVQLAAQRAEGDEKVRLLKLVCEKYDDCYYGDACRTGAMARLILWRLAIDKGQKDEARRLEAELRKDYGSCVDHDGRLILEWLVLGSLKTEG